LALYQPSKFVKTEKQVLICRVFIHQPIVLYFLYFLRLFHNNSCSFIMNHEISVLTHKSSGRRQIGTLLLKNWQKSWKLCNIGPSLSQRFFLHQH